MLELLKQIFTVWNSEKNQRLKLQQAYLILAIIGLVVAGLSTLFSVSSAHLAASFSGILAVTFLVNGITWGLIDTFITPRLPKTSQTKSKTKSKTAKR